MKVDHVLFHGFRGLEIHLGKFQVDFIGNAVTEANIQPLISFLVPLYI